MSKAVRRNRLKMVVLGGCTAAIVVGGSLAYLTATDNVKNEFNVEAALTEKITVIEPNWDPKNGVNIVPTQTVPKDPQMKNESDIPVYAIMQVSVPHAKVTTAAADGTPKASVAQDLFTYTVNSGWSEVGTGALASDGKHMVHTYLLDSQLPAGATSKTVFDRVTLVNAIDGELDGQKLAIDVNGYAIQAEGFSSASDAWNAYQKQNA